MTAPLTPKVSVQFDTKGVGEVQRGLKLVGSTGESTGRQVGMSMRQIAGGVEQIARQGKITGEAMKSIIAQGAEFAFMFGLGGPIVGALAITGLAIYEHVTSRLKEAREEINKTRTAIEDIRRSTDLMDVGRKQQGLFSGDPAAIRKEGESAAAFLARSRGLEGVNARMGQLQGRMPASIMREVQRGARSFAGHPSQKAAYDEYNEFAELFGLRGSLDQQFKEAQKGGERLGAGLSEGIKRGMAEDAAKATAAAALSPEQMAAHGKMDALLDPIIARGLSGVQMMQGGGTQTTTRLGGDEGFRAFGIKAADVGKGFELHFVNPLAETIQRSIAGGIGDAISAGFDAAFARGGNLVAGAKALGASALSTMGGVFKDIGIQSLLGMQFMQSIKLAIAAWNPALGIAASIGLIALGSAMQAGGNRLGGGGGGSFGGGGGGGGSSQPMIIDRGFINPTNASTTAGNVSMRNMIVLAPTIIGVNDPSAQRGIKELIRNADARGAL